MSLGVSTKKKKTSKTPDRKRKREKFQRNPLTRSQTTGDLRKKTNLSVVTSSPKKVSSSLSCMSPINELWNVLRKSVKQKGHFRKKGESISLKEAKVHFKKLYSLFMKNMNSSSSSFDFLFYQDITQVKRRVIDMSSDSLNYEEYEEMLKLIEKRWNQKKKNSKKTKKQEEMTSRISSPAKTPRKGRKNYDRINGIKEKFEFEYFVNEVYMKFKMMNNNNNSNTAD